jgi:ankyrin repeat protein
MEAKILEAAAGGNAAELAALTQGGVGIDSRDPELGATALVLAAYFGHPACVQLLLESGADKEASDDQRATAAVHRALWPRRSNAKTKSHRHLRLCISTMTFVSVHRPRNPVSKRAIFAQNRRRISRVD